MHAHRPHSLSHSNPRVDPKGPTGLFARLHNSRSMSRVAFADIAKQQDNEITPHSDIMVGAPKLVQYGSRLACAARSTSESVELVPIDSIMSNENIESPLDPFLGWYSSLPTEQQEVIALSAHFIPGFNIDVAEAIEKNNAAVLFADRVVSYRDRSSSERCAATVLHMCLEHIAFANQGTGNWRERQAALREYADDFGYPALHDAANAAQFKHAQWVQTRKKWNQLKAGSFSIDVISSFRVFGPSGAAS